MEKYRGKRDERASVTEPLPTESGSRKETESRTEIVPGTGAGPGTGFGYRSDTESGTGKGYITENRPRTEMRTEQKPGTEQTLSPEQNTGLEQNLGQKQKIGPEQRMGPERRGSEGKLEKYTEYKRNRQGSNRHALPARQNHYLCGSPGTLMVQQCNC